MPKGKTRDDGISIVDATANTNNKSRGILNYATGIYPRSSSLITATRRLPRDDPKLKTMFINGKRSWINTQLRTGLSYIADPMIDWDDIFRPFSKVNGIRLGALNRFFETNTFYRRLIVEGELDGYGDIVLRHLALDLIDDKKGRSKARYRKVACIPDPYTFAYMNENTYYKGYEDYMIAVADMLNKEAKTLAENGVDIIHLSAPAVAYSVNNGISIDLDLVKEAVERVKSKVKSKVYLYLYFGNVADVFDRLLDIKVDGIGIDVISTRIASIVDYSIDKDLIIGIVDSMNTRLEDVRSVASALDLILNKINAKNIVLTVNNSLEFLPYMFAIKKLSILGKITKLLKAKQDGLVL